jgi:hypothetical protein
MTGRPAPPFFMFNGVKYDSNDHELVRWIATVAISFRFALEMIEIEDDKLDAAQLRNIAREALKDSLPPKKAVTTKRGRLKRVKRA